MDNEKEKSDMKTYYSKVKITDVKEYDDKTDNIIVKNVVQKCNGIIRKMVKNENKSYLITYEAYSYVYDQIVEEFKNDLPNADKVFYINSLVSKVFQYFYGFSYFIPPSVIDEHNKNVGGYKR